MNRIGRDLITEAFRPRHHRPGDQPKREGGLPAPRTQPDATGGGDTGTSTQEAAIPQADGGA
jgi:hypothetical protein